MTEEHAGHLTRRSVLKLAAAGPLWAVLPHKSFGDLGGSSERKPPNIIFIMGDDFSTTEVSCYGASDYHTPNIDALAQHGLRFNTCWATPLCAPTRAELMTGRYGFRTRWYHNWMAPYGEPLIDKHKVYPQVLKDAGYATAVAGKWHHTGEPYDYGFDEYCISWGSSGKWVDGGFKPKPGYRFWDPSIVKNGVHVPTGPDAYGPDINADFLIDFMSRKKERPFFAYFPTILAHSPHYPTPDSMKPGVDKFVGDWGAHFKANIDYADKLVGRIVGALERLGIRDNTIVFFATDNGTPPYKAHANEAGCRVPMIASCPALLKASGVSDELIDFSDLFPTFVELAGGNMPCDYVIDGHSFAPLLLGKPFHGRDWIFSWVGEMRMLRDKRWLMQGGDRFYDCGDSRDGTGYKRITDLKDPEAAAARERFEKLLKHLPAPPEDDPLYPGYREEERKFRKAYPNYSIL